MLRQKFHSFVLPHFSCFLTPELSKCAGRGMMRSPTADNLLFSNFIHCRPADPDISEVVKSQLFCLLYLIIKTLGRSDIVCYFPHKYIIALTLTSISWEMGSPITHHPCIARVTHTVHIGVSRSLLCFVTWLIILSCLELKLSQSIEASFQDVSPSAPT